MINRYDRAVVSLYPAAGVRPGLDHRGPLFVGDFHLSYALADSADGICRLPCSPDPPGINKGSQDQGNGRRGGKRDPEPRRDHFVRAWPRLSLRVCQRQNPCTHVRRRVSTEHLLEKNVYQLIREFLPLLHLLAPLRFSTLHTWPDSLAPVSAGILSRLRSY